MISLPGRCRSGTRSLHSPELLSLPLSLTFLSAPGFCTMAACRRVDICTYGHIHDACTEAQSCCSNRSETRTEVLLAYLRGMPRKMRSMEYQQARASTSESRVSNHTFTEIISGVCPHSPPRGLDCSITTHPSASRGQLSPPLYEPQ